MTKKLVRVDSLAKGQTFWLLHRGWIVRRKLANGKVRCECLDDGGQPDIEGGVMVEPLGRQEQPR